MAAFHDGSVFTRYQALRRFEPLGSIPSSRRRKYGVRILISQTARSLHQLPLEDVELRVLRCFLCSQVAQCCTKEMSSKMRLIDKAGYYLEESIGL